MLFNTKIITLFERTLGTIQSYQCKTLDVYNANAIQYSENGKRGLTRAWPLHAPSIVVMYNIFKHGLHVCCSLCMVAVVVSKKFTKLRADCGGAVLRRLSAAAFRGVLSSCFFSLHWWSWQHQPCIWWGIDCSIARLFLEWEMDKTDLVAKCLDEKL